MTQVSGVADPFPGLGQYKANVNLLAKTLIFFQRVKVKRKKAEMELRLTNACRKAYCASLHKEVLDPNKEHLKEKNSIIHCLSLPEQKVKYYTKA